MDQVSLPMRIALLAVLAFASLWFVALRPKPATTPAPAPAAKTGSAITGAPAKAEKAVENGNAATGARKQAAEPSAPAKPAAKPAAAKPSTANATAQPAKAAEARKPGEKDAPKAVKNVLADLDAKRAVVLLFWDGSNSDDREVRRAVRGVDRRDGKVRVHVAKIGRLGDFETITRGVPVVTSPTVLVIDRNRRARVVSGLTVTRELDELVGKALAGK